MHVPEEMEDAFQDFILSCRARGSSAAQEFLDYVRSQTLDTTRVPEAYLDTCFKCHKVTDLVYQFKAVSGKRLVACEDCFKLTEEKGLVARIIKRPPK